MTRHLRATLELVAPTVRLVPWWHVTAGAVIAAALLLPSRANPHLTVGGAVEMVRLAMIPLAVSVAFVLDDPTAQVANSTPVPLVARRGLRVTVVTVVVAGFWAGVLLLIGSAPALDATTDPLRSSTVAVNAEQRPEVNEGNGTGGQEPEPVAALPSGMLTLEFGALTGLTLAVAAVANRRHRDALGGLIAAPAALGSAAAATMLPASAALFTRYATPPPDLADPSLDWLAWVAAHQRWAVVAASSGVVLALALCDPARRLVPRVRPIRGVAVPSREPAATTSRST